MYRNNIKVSSRPLRRQHCDIFVFHLGMRCRQFLQPRLLTLFRYTRRVHGKASAPNVALKSRGRELYGRSSRRLATRNGLSIQTFMSFVRALLDVDILTFVQGQYVCNADTHYALFLNIILPLSADALTLISRGGTMKYVIHKFDIYVVRSMGDIFIGYGFLNKF